MTLVRLMVNRLWVKALSDILPCGNLWHIPILPGDPHGHQFGFANRRGPRAYHRGAYCFEPGIRSVVHPESNKRSCARSSRCAHLNGFQAARAQPSSPTSWRSSPQECCRAWRTLSVDPGKRPSSIKVLAPSRRCLAVPLCLRLRAAWGDMPALEKGVQKACSAFSDQQPWASLDMSSVSEASMPPGLQTPHVPERRSCRCDAFGFLQVPQRCRHPR